MSNHFRLPLVAAIVLSGSVHAGDDQTADESNWLDSTRATCAQQYSVEQCRDEQFLDEHYHVRNLQTAHRAAIRRNDMERRALRELLLQRTCGNTAAYCADGAANCAVQLQQMCTAIQQQAANCLSQAAQYCAVSPTADCFAQRQLLCPSAKKQSIDELLVKYPKLSLQQQTHIRQVAQQMDANQDSHWIGNLFRLLGFAS